MTYKYMVLEELEAFLDIDRREVIEHIYYYRDGKLELEEEHYDMGGFPEGEQQVLLERQRQIIESGGYIIGAYNGDTLIGITSVENKLRGKEQNYIKMDILFVSKNYRGKGVAKALMERATLAAQKLNGKKLYISATPSENTINFYFSMGCVLAKELDEELFELEPYDIHLELDLESC